MSIYSALKEAAENGMWDRAHFLIFKGIDEIENTGYEQSTRKSKLCHWGLFGAAFGGHLELVKYFIKIAKDLNCAVYWNNCLTHAAKGGHINTVRFFIENGADDMNMGLLGAAEGGHINLIYFFMEKGANRWDMGLYGAQQGSYVYIGAERVKTDIINLFIARL